MNLSIVVPVWNDPQGLELRIFNQVVVVDDASDLDCDPSSLGFTGESIGATLLYLRSAKQAGAGAARNLGLERVTSEHVIFFDADDLLDDAFPDVWELHRGATGDACPDFTMFRHADNRVESNEGRRGSFLPEEHLWDLALAGRDVAGLGDSQKSLLAQTINYPWNKIYRTAFLRKEGIRCSETVVHNDILLHWESFLKARHVLATRIIGAQHIVATGKGHLTHRASQERFCVFGVLGHVVLRLRESQYYQAFLVGFVRFVIRVLRWNLGVVEERLREDFTKSIRAFFVGVLGEELNLFSLASPVEAESLGEFLNGWRQSF